MEAVKRKKKRCSKTVKKQEKQEPTTSTARAAIPPVALSQEAQTPVSNESEQSILPDAVQVPPPQMEEIENSDAEDLLTDLEESTDFAPTAPRCRSVSPVATLPALLYPDLSQLLKECNIDQINRRFPAVTIENSSELCNVSSPQARTLYLECIQQMEQTSLESDSQHLDALEHQFIKTESPHAVAKGPDDYDSDLHLSLQTYRTAYHSYCEVVKERLLAQQQIASLRGRCWDFQQVKFSASGHCDDSRMVTVSTKSRVASLNVERCKEAKAEMSALLDRCVTKEKEALIQLHHTRAMVEKNVTDPPIPGYERSAVLRLKLRIIGNALRTEMHQRDCDKGDSCEYVENLRKWFILLGTGMLRAGSVDERVWLMFHLLRFPNGIGTWAHVLVHPLPFGKQEDQLGDIELDAIFTLIHVLVRPITERQTFLAPVEETVNVENSPPLNDGKADDNFEWVDSDGEDSSTDKRIRPIKESDLLALLDQIPFRRLFGSVTNRSIECLLHPGGEHLPMTEMLCLISFANKLIAILGEGLVTYGGGIARYSHFAQRLALLINDTVKFVGDVMRLYGEAQNRASEECEVVQVHFDTLMYRAARSIYGGGVALARHLSSLPFALLSSRACWWMFACMVNRNFHQQPDFDSWRDIQRDLRGSTLMEQFEEQLAKKMSPHDLYNMLKPIVDLALARSDSGFIYSVAKTLFELLAALPADALVCAEIIMEQIHIIMERDPDILSGLLKTLHLTDDNRKQTIANGWQMKGNILLEVFSSKKQLIMRWHPDDFDIKMLTSMLLNYPRTHIYHKLSLGLLMYIKYGDSGRYYVSKDLQQSLAYYIAVAFQKHHPLKTDPSGTASATVSAEQQTELQNYQERCMFVLLQLRLHAFDQPLLYMRPYLEDPYAVETKFFPEPAQLVKVPAAIQERCPVACLCALLCSTMGNWVPVFCQDGITALTIMYEQHDLDTVVVRCVELITHLFVDCPLALANNVQFITILTKLVENDNTLDWSRQTADEQHHTLAMKLLEGTNMGKMGAMLVSQTALYWRLGYATPPSLICMWFDCLAEIKQWINNAKVLRLMNVLAAVSFGHVDAWTALRDRFRPFFKSLSVVKYKQHSLWSKIVGTEPPLLYGTLPSDCVALALLVFGIEHQQLEMETELWPKLLRTLKKKRTIKIDEAMREVIGTLRCQEKDFCPAAHSLVLFKVARFLIRANIEHPHYLALCQLFFTLLLTRVTDVGDEVHGVADLLYGYDTGLMEKIKQILCKLELHYNCLQETNGDAVGMLRLVKAFQLWLVDTDLNRIDTDVPINLPNQYAISHLQSALHGAQEFWLECTNNQTFLAVQRMMIEGWYNLYRVLPDHSSAQGNILNGAAAMQTALLPPTQAIERRLENSYTDPQPIHAPEHRAELQDLADALKKPPMVRVKRITESLRIVKQHIDKTHWSMKNELRMRENELFELFQQLYVNEDKQIVQQAKCSMLYCTGAASIKLHTKCAVIDKNVQDRVAARLVGMEAFLQLVINIPPYIMKHTMMLRELWNSLFVEYCSEADRASAQTLSEAIRTMLRTLLHEVSDANFVPPLTFAVRLSLDTYRSDLANIMLEEVGQMFAGALEEGRKPCSVIVAMLENSRIPVRPLLQVYGQLVKQKSGNLERSIFIDLFGKKIHLLQWLNQHNITSEEVDQFAKLIVIGMYKSRPVDSVSLARSVDETEQDVQFCDMLLSHLEILASHKFPDNFGKMMQHILNACSQWPTLPPTMLLKLLNVLRTRANLPDLQLGMEENVLRQAHRQFAEANCAEPVLSFEVLESIIVAVTEHFARQRDSMYPWNGMYKRHGAYVEVIGMLLGLLSHSFLMHGMQDNRIRAVQEHLLPVVYRMFEPWIVPYGAVTPTLQLGNSHPSPKESSNRHVNNDKAKWMFSVLLEVVNYALEKVLVAYADTDNGSQILLYFLHWYVEWFVDARIMISVLYVFNSLVLELPWERLQPSDMLIERMHYLLEHHSPECHELLACVFVRCNWTVAAGNGPLPVWLQRTHAATLAISVRLAYEPVIRSDVKVRAAMVRLLQYFTELTWESLHVAELTPALDWFVMTGDTGSMLRTPNAPCHELDDALIRYLEVVAGMRFNEANRLVPGDMQLMKRKLYINVVVRMLMNAGRVSGGKMVTNFRPQLISAIQQLLGAISTVLEGLPLQQDTDTDGPRLIEAQAMVAELLTSIKKWHTESTLSLFVDELIAMLENDPNSPVLTVCVLESAVLLDRPAEHWMRLLESALSHYLRSSSDASWLQALKMVGYEAIGRWQTDLLYRHCLPLCFELYFLHHWHNSLCNIPAQNEVLSKLEVQAFKPYECELYPLWCSIIYALFTVRPDPHVAIRTTIGLFDAIREDNTFWAMGVLKKILGKERAPASRASHCLIAYALATLVAHVYASRTPLDETFETDDYSHATGSNELFTLGKLLSAPEKRASRQRIAATAMEHFKAVCSASGYKEHQSRIIEMILSTKKGKQKSSVQILQLATDIIILLDSRAEPFLKTLQDAIFGDSL